MRLVFCLILGGFLGWIAGSLYPAPHALLAWINPGAIEQRLSGGEGAPTAATTTAAAATTTAITTATATTTATVAQLAASPARSHGAVDEGTLNQYRAWISEARQTHPYADSEERMYAVMMCESRGQAGLVNQAGPYSGLFQYGPSTWRGAWNTYRDQNIRDARAQIFATALAWHNHMQGQWGCYSHPH